MNRYVRIAAPAAVTLFAVIGLLLSQQPAGRAWTGAAVTIGTAVVLAWRQATGWVLAAGLAVALAGFVASCGGLAGNLGWFGVCVLASWCALAAKSRETAALTVLSVVVLVVQFVDQPVEAGWGAWASGTVFTAVACTLARRQGELLQQLSTAQAGLADRARAEERSRIAGEMHDVIGHALTVSLLHVSTARLAVEEGATEEALAALDQAESQSRRSLEEVRSSVGLLRSTGAVAPLPGAADLGALVDSFRSAGTPVTCEVSGDLAGLPASTGLAAYRIVQEALTNVARHAAGSPARVLVEVAGTETRLLVESGGRPGRRTAGNGLLGMAERAEAVGGRLSAGPSESGWRVEAVLPA